MHLGSDTLPVKKPVQVIHQSLRTLRNGASEYVMDILHEAP